MPVTLLLALLIQNAIYTYFTLFNPRGADYARHTTASSPVTQNNSDMKMLILGYDMANSWS